MDFIKEAYSMVVGNITFSQSDWGKTCLKNHLTFVIARAQMSITKWALEDPDIMRLLADNISQTIFFSDASKALPPCADDFSCFKICNGLQIEDKFLNLDVLQSMLPLLLELASESPLLSRAREGGGDVMWDDDSMNMLNSAELMCRLVVFLTEVTLWLSGSQIVPCNYDEILATGIMCAELVSMLADMCIAASYYSFDSMAISKIGTEWALLMSSIKLLNGHSKPLLEPEGVEQSDATKSKYANLRKILRQLTRIDIKF